MFYAVYYKKTKKMSPITGDLSIVNADLKRLSAMFMHLTVEEVKG